MELDWRFGGYLFEGKVYFQKLLFRYSIVDLPIKLQDIKLGVVSASKMYSSFSFLVIMS